MSVEHRDARQQGTSLRPIGWHARRRAYRLGLTLLSGGLLFACGGDDQLTLQHSEESQSIHSVTNDLPVWLGFSNTLLPRCSYLDGKNLALVRHPGQGEKVVVLEQGHALCADTLANVFAAVVRPAASRQISADCAHDPALCGDDPVPVKPSTDDEVKKGGSRQDDPVPVMPKESDERPAGDDPVPVDEQ